MNKFTFINKLQWHYDAIINGGASLLDCLKIELVIWKRRQ